MSIQVGDGRALEGEAQQGLEATRMLIVAEHRLFVEAVGAALNARGYEIVATGGSAAEGVTLARRTRPDLVLLEMDPDRTAIEAGKAILMEYPEAKIVILSSVADVRTTKDTVEAGFHGYVTQESGIASLTDAMRAISTGNTVLPNAAGWEGDFGTDSAEESRRSATLSRREREILQLLGQGLSTGGIARRLHISPQTVRSHVQSIFFKLRVHSRLEAVAIARRVGLAATASSVGA